MRRFRLHIGGNIQPEIIDNLKTSLYQTTPKHTGKNNKQKIVYMNTFLTASSCNLRIEYRMFKVTEVFSTPDLATR